MLFYFNPKFWNRTPSPWSILEPQTNPPKLLAADRLPVGLTSAADCEEDLQRWGQMDVFCASFLGHIGSKTTTSERFFYQWWLPLVPHKAAAFQNRKPIGEFGCCESRMAEGIHWFTERWLDLCLLEWLRWLQWPPHPQLLDWVWCSAAVVAM